MDVNIIFGPPGTGKTYTLLEILSEELKTYEPEEIAYVSFTKEGANQGKERASKELGIAKNRMEYFRTLHSIAFKETNMKRVQVINKRFYKIFSEKMGMHFTGYYTEELHHNDDRYLFFNILHRNNPKTAKRYMNDLDIQKLQHVTHNYKRFKHHYGLFDFTDMIELFNKNNTALPVKIAIIDEAQDLSTLQWEMIWIAFKDCDKIYIAGDDDQAIYEWSGADVDYFLKLNGNIRILNQSYRLPNNVLSFSKSILNQIEHRVSKEYKGLSKDGNVTDIVDIDEVDLNNGETWMILCRNRYFLKEVEQKIRSKGLVYTKFKEPSVKTDDIKIINLFEKVRKTRIMNQAEEIKLKLHMKKDFDLSLPWYDNLDWSYDKLAYFRDILANKTNTKNINIKIETIHSVKGDESDNVILMDNISRQVYLNTNNNPDSEHRVFYVGCTRAKKNLFILNGSTTYRYKFY